MDRGALGGGEQDGIRRSLLRDAVFMRLLDLVLRGEYRRGQRLRLDTIAEDMRVSRTPVREALVPLESLRLVSVQRYVGVVIANWTVDHVVERIRIARSMIAEPLGSSVPSSDRFDPSLLRSCVTEGGVLVEMASWYLRRSGAVVSADWVLSQRELLDLFFVDDVAVANGIDVAVDRRARMHVVERARVAAAGDDLPRVRRELLALADGLITLPGRFRGAA